MSETNNLRPGQHRRNNRLFDRLQPGETVESLARRGIQLEAEGRHNHEIVQMLGIHPSTWQRIRAIVMLADDDGLRPEQREVAQTALAAINRGGSIETTYQSIADLYVQKFGTKRNPGGLNDRFEARRAAAERAVIQITAACTALDQVEVPIGIPAAQRTEWLADLRRARSALYRFYTLIQET